MHIRLLTTADISQAKQLANYAFNEKDFANWFFDKYVQPQQLVGSFAEADLLKCMLCLSPYKLQMFGTELDTDYITTVTTAADVRGKGYFKPLLKYTFEHMRKLGKSVAILKAIESKLYSPFGFAFCYSHLRYTMPITELEYFAKAADITLLSIPEFEQHISSMQQLYAALVLNKYHAASERTIQNWRNLLTVHTAEGGHIMLAFRGNIPVGYMLYYVRNNYFEVFELLATDAAVQAHFLNTAYQHRTQAKSFFWRTFADNTAYLAMNISQYNDSFYPQLAPFMMVRVVDARRLLAQMVTTAAASVRIKITDEFLEFNNCTLQLVAKDGQLSVQDTVAPADITIDITTLAQLVFGAYSISELLFADKIVQHNAHCIAELNKLFSKKTNYINEEF